MRIRYLVLITPTLGLLFGQVIPQTMDWPAYGRDPGAVRFSPLDQINTTNVSQLQRPWTYHTGERGRAFEATPIVVVRITGAAWPNGALEPMTPKRVAIGRTGRMVLTCGSEPIGVK